MTACELALTTTKTAVGFMRSQVACVDALVLHIKDSGRLDEAVVKRLEILRKL